MITELRSILQQYWGHRQFRPNQEEIIRSAMEGHDTLALLPTGGGKSVCFQVPAMAKKGICIVVSPLIALMKDQVRNLNQKGIKSLAIVSGMDKREIDITLDNCVYGDVKFLYVSPERLQTTIFKERVKKMHVNFIAVDEAHCISQWGYDFRPPYLQIAELRELLPHVPVIALTATATPEVIEDIQLRLNFKNGKVFKSSFARKNLAYLVRKEEDKHARLIKLFHQIPGTGIVYVRNRKRTMEFASFLQKNGIKADYYHAGLEGKIREEKQKNWIDGKTRVICSTNAFGMGIDKPDVRLVVHLDLPDSPEAYFQEAGRGGRDGEKAWSIILYDDADLFALEESVKQSFPDPEIIKRSYVALCNYYQLAVGSGLDESYEFDLSEFSERFGLIPNQVFHSLKLLELGGFIQLSDAFSQPSHIRMLMNAGDLYNFQISNKSFDGFIKLLLRSYSGLFDGAVKINEKQIAERSNKTEEVIVRYLQKLDELKVLVYVPRTDKPRINFTRERVQEKDFVLTPEVYLNRKKTAFQRMETMLNYVQNTSECRSTILLRYFGEDPEYRCGICDHCLRENKIHISNIEMNSISEEIKKILGGGPLGMKALRDQLTHHNENKVKTIIRWLLDNDNLKINEHNQVFWNTH